MSFLKEIFTATKTVLKDPKCLYTFFILSLGTFLLLIMVPVWVTPGNDFLFQLSIMEPALITLMVLLSAGNALVLTMQLYAYMLHQSVDRKTGHRATLTSFLFSMGSAAIACGACYSSVLSVLGLGATTFAFKYRFVIGGFALTITLWALYQGARKINGTCEVCAIRV